MEVLTVNVTGKTRRETFNGREYIVAPLTMIVPGVLKGSKGPLYYPEDEVTRDPSVWNGMPIVVYHPTHNGQPVSARDPDILNKSQIGHVYRARAHKGKLKAEGWFDVADTRRVDERVYNALEAEETMELSTGLFLDQYKAPPGATYNGVEYTYTTANYKPDHLAILPDQRGACSLADGCGMCVNTAWAAVNQMERDCECADPSECDCEKWHTVDNSGWEEVPDVTKSLRQLAVNLDLSYDEIESRVRSAFYKAHPVEYDSSGMSVKSCYLISIYDKYLIYSEDDELYRQNYTLSKSGSVTIDDESEAVDKVVKYVPTTTDNRFSPQTFEEVQVTKLTANERKGIIDDLVENCDCWKDEGDRDVLNRFTDEKLVALKERQEKEQHLIAVANAAVQGVKDGDMEFRINQETGKWEKRAVTNAGSAQTKSTTTKKTAVDDGEYEEEDTPKKKVTKNAADDAPPPSPRRRPRNLEEFVRNADASIRDELEAKLRTADMLIQREKDKLVGEILANVAEPDRPSRREWLQEQSVEFLENMKSMMPKTPSPEEVARLSNNRRRRQQQEPTDNDMLGVPTYNWTEIGKGGGEDQTGKSQRAVQQQQQQDDVVDNFESEEDAFRNLPAHIKSRVENALRIEEQERNRLIDDIVANSNIDEEQEAVFTKTLKSKSLDELKLLSKVLIKNEPTRSTPRWFGASAPAPTANRGGAPADADDILPPPSYNWHEVAGGKN